MNFGNDLVTTLSLALVVVVKQCFVNTLNTKGSLTSYNLHI